MLSQEDQKYLTEVILTHGFRAAVTILERRGIPRNEAHSLIQDLHDLVPGAVSDEKRAEILSRQAQQGGR